MLLSVNQLNKKINDKVLFRDATFSIEENEKIALVGVNGTGKSTFLKVIAGVEQYDSGTIITKNGIKIHYLAQNPVFKKDTIWQEISFVNDHSQHPQEEFQVKSILTKLGLMNFEQEIESMSGGQQRKLSLACALVSECDLLLLDEPTNHLDHDMVEWLENYLVHTKCSILMVTHDRYFLDRICTKIFELDQGDFYVHKGNYEVYLEDKEHREELEQLAIQKHKNLYLKELAWVRAGCQARSTKQQSRLNRFEQLRNQRFKSQQQALELKVNTRRLGKKTIEVNNVSFGYDQLLFKDFTYNFLRNDRIGIIGPNGCGKSTLLNVLAGELSPLTGTIEYGETVSVSYFKQQDLSQFADLRVIDYIEKTSQVIEEGNNILTAAQMLERFLFPRKMQYTTISRLSGGERKRLYLCKILMECPNVLILDEPTNDLDILTLEILEDYLDDFNGIVIVVSHDRYFLDRVCDKVFIFQKDKTIEPYIGGYSDYLDLIENEKIYQKQEKKIWKTNKKITLTYMEKKELESLNKEMPILEDEISELNGKINTTVDYPTLNELCTLRDEKENLLEEYTLRWMELEEKMEN